MAPTQRPTPPDVGKNVPVRVTPDFHADLTTLMRGGTNASDAIRHAVAHMATAYRRAWLRGDTPDTHNPTIGPCIRVDKIAPAEQPPAAE